jgi:hypothetical protein
MKILDAILGEIEPYSFSDRAINKALADACMHLSEQQLSADEDYAQEHFVIVSLASMMLLVKAVTLSSESIQGGISQSYVPDSIKKRVRLLAERAGLSPALVLPDSEEPTITSANVW